MAKEAATDAEKAANEAKLALEISDKALAEYYSMAEESESSVLPEALERASVVQQAALETIKSAKLAKDAAARAKAATAEAIFEAQPIKKNPTATSIIRNSADT